MVDFDKLAFEQLMGDAVQLHGKQEYEAALTLSTQAYNLAPDNSFEKGRAARDTSARHDRLGHHEEAESWAHTAYAVHSGLVASMEQPTREALRERSVSAMYVGVNGLRKVFAARKAGVPAENPGALAAMRQTWFDLKAAKSQAQGINHRVDQYEVNAARRVSMAESLLGNKRAGLAIGARAVGLAFLSESLRLDTANPNLTPKQRVHAKTKAFLGGVAALVVNLASIPKFGKSQQLAHTIAAKAL